MITILIFASLIVNITDTAQAIKKVQAPNKEVVVQAQKISIPHIPTSVNQAHLEYKQVNAYLINTIHDLENDLLDIYKEETSKKALPRSIQTLPSEADAVTFFIKIFRDKEHEKLKAEVISALDS